MRSFALVFVVLLGLGHTSPIHENGEIGPNDVSKQEPLNVETVPSKLHGRFLHITDLHPDRNYKKHSSTSEEKACHRGHGPAGTYGAEISDCDSPYALINATFKWLEENVKDSIDFVIWTGDSARHDNDEKIPRSASEVFDSNKFIAKKFNQVFGNKKGGDDSPADLSIPVVPTFGNNDILPHNILLEGPNKWLKSYASIWRKFIPEEQRHGFERGGSFWVEVIPNKLAVFSLNTLYFFDHNTAVDGCTLKSEPGFELMEWLRIQLQFMRSRGMKAILMGHVPPARTNSKQLWDESCWQKYTLWLRQYRDIVIGGLYGHMNIDHFFLQDSEDVDIEAMKGKLVSTREHLDDELSIESATDYLEELRENWAKLPHPSEIAEIDDSVNLETKPKKGKKHKSKWGERFQVTYISPSVVPNYFPTIRIFEYNITGLDPSITWASQVANSEKESNFNGEEDLESMSFDELDFIEDEVSTEGKKKKKGKKHKGKKKPKTPDLTIPKPPSKKSPPGPAYSPQTLSFLGYTQYFANLTHINNIPLAAQEDFKDDSWHEGKHKGKVPKEKISHPKKFEFEVEYSTFNDSFFKLPDLTAKSYLKLARRIGQYSQSSKSFTDSDIDDVQEDFEESDDEELDAQGGKNHKKKNEKVQKKRKNKAWTSFVKRAFVGTISDEDLRNLQVVDDLEIEDENIENTGSSFAEDL